jgi:hypothetical protein
MMLNDTTSTEATEWSLFADLTQGSGRSFSATDTVKELLECICSYVCDLKRNTQISYRFARRAADIYIAISMRIEKVDAASESVLGHQIGSVMDEQLKGKKCEPEFEAALNMTRKTMSLPFGKTLRSTPPRSKN